MAVSLEVGRSSSFCISRRISFLDRFKGLFARTGLGSSLGAGEGKTVAIVLYFVRHAVYMKRQTYFCATVDSGTAGLDTLGRGVGRTGAPGPVIHGFCREPPKRVLSVVFEDSTSRWVGTDCASLSGGRRIVWLILDSISASSSQAMRKG